MDEFELKLAVPASRRAGLVRALVKGASRAKRIKAVYFDTEDDRLASGGVALRLRQEGRQWVQTAKAPSTDLLRRLEHNVELATPPSGGQPTLDIARHDGTPAGKALHKALRAGRNDVTPGALIERFRTDFSRRARMVRIGETSVELALDIGRITGGEREVPLSELELELKSGPVAPLFQLAAQWAEQHGLLLEVESKGQRGTRLARGETTAKPAVAEPLRFDMEQGTETFVRATVQNSLAQVIRNADSVAAGAIGEEFVHQLRIGLRRLRTALREFGDRVGADLAWEPVLRQAFQDLGQHRDRTVVLPAIRTRLEVAGAPTLPELNPAIRLRRPDLIARAPELQKVLIGVLACCQPSSSAAVPRPGAVSTRALVAPRLTALHRKLVRDADRFDKLDVPRQHRVRKRLKRLRYLSEFCAPLFGNSAVKRYLSVWRAAQEALGAYNDQRMASMVFESEVKREPSAWFAVGWLNARNETCAGDCRRALRAGAKHRPFWKK